MGTVTRHLSAMLAATLLAATAVAPAPAQAATEIDMYFPAPAQSGIAAALQQQIDIFNKDHPDFHVTPVFAGGYYETDVRTEQAIQTGHSPAVAVVKTDFLRAYIASGDIVPLDNLAAKDSQTPEQFLSPFWPELRPSAMGDGHLYDVPFQLATPLLYYNVDAFKEVGLDPDRPPATWTEWVAAAKKLVKKSDGSVSRWGVMMPLSADWCGWMVSALAMSNGAEFYNARYGGSVYYSEPGTVGAVRLLDSFVHRSMVMPEGFTDPQSVITAFAQGHTAMMLMSSDTLAVVRDVMKTPFRTAFVPRSLMYAAPFTGAALVVPKGNSPERQAAAWALIKWLVSPNEAAQWSRLTGSIAPVPAAYAQDDMQAFLKQNPDFKVAVDQAVFARGWFSSYHPTGVRTALEEGVQAVLTSKSTPAAAMLDAQRTADALMRPLVERTALNTPE